MTVVQDPPRLAPAARRTFGPGRERGPLADGRLGPDFLAGLGFDSAAANRHPRRGNTFVDLLDGLLAASPDQRAAALGAVDLAVIAHHTPDLDYRESAACYLTHVLPAAPETFAVSDQGVGAPFTALRLLGAMIGAARSAPSPDRADRAAALFVLEQAAQLLPDMSAAETGITDSAVAFLVGGDGPTVVLDTVEVPAADSAAAVEWLSWAVTRARAEVRSYYLWDASPYTAVTVIAGTGLNSKDVAAAVQRSGDGVGPVTVRPVPARHLCTAVWAALADELPEPGALVLADRDRRSGRLFLALLAVDRAGPAAADPGGAP